MENRVVRLLMQIGSGNVVRECRMSQTGRAAKDDVFSCDRMMGSTLPRRILSASSDASDEKPLYLVLDIGLRFDAGRDVVPANKAFETIMRSSIEFDVGPDGKATNCTQAVSIGANAQSLCVGLHEQYAPTVPAKAHKGRAWISISTSATRPEGLQ